MYYFYPGQSDETEFNEYYLSLGTDISITDDISISPYVYLAYAPKWFGPNTPEAFYSEVGAEVPIAGTPFTLSGLFGNIDISDCEGDAEEGNCTDSWNYYYITLGCLKKLKNPFLLKIQIVMLCFLLQMKRFGEIIIKK